MTNLDFPLNHCGWLIVGFRVGREEQFKLIALCRRFDGAVIFRAGEVMVVEIGAFPGVIDDLLTRLPRKSVTHLWRSGSAPISGVGTARQGTNFCSI
jgi:hypothetical protein